MHNNPDKDCFREGTEQEREEMDRLASGISDYLQCLVVVLNRAGEVVYYNNLCEKIIGIPFEEAAGKYYWDIFCAPEERELYKAFFFSLEPGQFPFEVETQTPCSGDEWIDILWTYNSMPVQKSEAKYFVLTGMEITSYNRNKRKLQEMAEKYRAIIHASPVAVITLDVFFKVKSWSPVTEKLLGWPEKEVRDKEVFRFLEDSRRTVLESCKKVLSGKMIDQKELSFFRKDESRIYVNLSMAPLRNYMGEIEGLVLVAFDITERKRAEKALKDSEKKYRDILSAMEEGYYEVDLEGNFVFFNDSFCEILGYTPEELKKNNYKSLYQDHHKIQQAFKRVYQTGKPTKAADWKVKTNQGKELILESSISLRHDEEDNVLGFRGVVRDITERKKAEERIRYLSFHDALTGLLNRAYLEEELKRLDTERQLPVSVIMADLNGLKLVNDTYGHEMGDELLKSAAYVLQKSCRKEDIIARWGGDEFVVLLPGVDADGVQNICKRLNKISNSAYVQDIPVSMAAGVAVKDKAGKLIGEILKEAEDDMYRQKLVESRSNRNAVLEALLKTLEEKSFETKEHVRRMQEIAFIIGEKLGLSDSEMSRLNVLISLHDIGKINIPEEILTKKEPLAPGEWEIMKRHPETGYRITRATEEFAHVAEDILSHHEWWDGSGYPRGLKGKEIPVLARITAIADSYEVMSNGRPYKNPLSTREIISEFKRCSGTQFDPELVEIFLSIMEEEAEKK